MFTSVRSFLEWMTFEELTIGTNEHKVDIN